MGGRGASSGMSHYERKDGTVVENPYGSQYHAVMTAGNVKFVSKNSRQSEPLMETMTGGAESMFASRETTSSRLSISTTRTNDRDKLIWTMLI